MASEYLEQMIELSNELPPTTTTNKKNKKDGVHELRRIFIMGIPKSGKSTFFHNLKRIYGDQSEFNEEYRMQKKERVELYIYHCIADIVKVMPNLIPPIRLENLTSLALACWLTENAERNFNLDKNKDVIFFNFIRYFNVLREDKGFQEALQRSSEYSIREHTKYFLDKIDMIFTEDYIPTVDDIFKSSAFPDTVQKLDIEYLDVKERNADVRCLKDLEEKKTLVNYQVINLGDKVIYEQQRCLPCIIDYNDIKLDGDFVPWLLKKPKYVNYSIIFLVDCSSEEKINESFKLLKFVIERWHCCCFMIQVINNKFDILVEFSKANANEEDQEEVDDGINFLLHRCRYRIFHQLLDISRPHPYRKREWIVGPAVRNVDISSLNLEQVKEVFEGACSYIERQEMRAQFEEVISKKTTGAGVTDFSSTSITAGYYNKDEIGRDSRIKLMLANCVRRVFRCCWKSCILCSHLIKK